MDEKSARVVIDAIQGRIELEGTEDFVERQVAAFGDLIKQAFRGPTKQPTASDSAPAPAHPAQNETLLAAPGLAGYEHLFAQNPQGKIQILTDLPGTSVATKMVNAAILLTLGNTLAGKTPTTFQEIREICAQHAALDSKNFASTLKEEKATFVFEGSGRNSQAVTFTVPGRKTADALAATLNQ